VLAAGLAVFAAPYLAVRPPQHHNFWIGIWEGLGDFDRTKGHCWRDSAAVRALHAGGLALDLDPDAPWSVLYRFVDAEAEEFFRRSVLRDIAADPGWYAAILEKRFVATVTQSKLAPWGPRDGLSMRLRTHPNQGEIDNYYRGTAMADFVQVGSRRWELPLTLLLAPGMALLAAAVAGRAIALLGEVRARCGRYLLVLLFPAAAALAMPVVMTTAAPQETQAFAIVYLAAWGFVAEEVCRAAVRIRGRSTAVSLHRDSPAAAPAADETGTPQTDPSVTRG
jgi:hypothetical protein